MTEIFDKFKIKVITDSIQRVQMDDATYFSEAYKDYVSNSKLGLLNPTQGGSPQKFFNGFKNNGSTSFALGSAVHQLTLEPNDYVLSDLTKPSGKLGKLYDLFIENLKKENLYTYLMELVLNAEDKFDALIDELESNSEIEKLLVLAYVDADYYTTELNKYSGKGLPPRLKNALGKLFTYFIAEKPEQLNNKSVIYLPSDLYSKCIRCTDSLQKHKTIQKLLKDGESYCEDVILADLEVSFPKDFNKPLGEEIKTIVKVKIKIDNWTINHKEKYFTLNDLKTTGKPVQYFMGHEEMEMGFMGEKKKVFINGSWQIFHYARQMGMYLWLLREYIKKEFGDGYKCTSNMLVVETIGDFGSNAFPVSNNEIVYGFTEFTQLLKRAAYHQVHGYETILEFAINNVSDDFDLEL